MSKTAVELTQEGKILSVTDKSVKALVAAVTNLNKTAVELSQLTDVTFEVATLVQEGQAKLDNIAEETEMAVRKAAAELKMQILENEETVLAGLMKSRHLATITHNTVMDMQNEINDLKADNAAAILKAVKSAVAVANAESEKTQAASEATSAITVAKLEAEKVALGSEVAFMRQSIADLKGQIDAERKARVEVAQAATKIVEVPVK